MLLLAVYLAPAHALPPLFSYSFITILQSALPFFSTAYFIPDHSLIPSPLLCDFIFHYCSDFSVSRSLSFASFFFSSLLFFAPVLLPFLQRTILGTATFSLCYTTLFLLLSLPLLAPSFMLWPIHPRRFLYFSNVVTTCSQFIFHFPSTATVLLPPFLIFLIDYSS